MRTALKLLSMLLIFLLCFSLSACGNKDSESDLSSEIDSSLVSSEPEPEAVPQIKYEINPLTGLETLTEDEVDLRPVAVAVSNISVAQPIQSGIGGADVVFETVTEGGITRLLALYKSPSEAVGNIGSIRSARVVFAELAASFNAVYVHHGMDEVYCRPLVNQLKIPRIEVSEKHYGSRISNGKAWEHRLYTSGSKLKTAIADKGYNKNGKSDPWLYFSYKKTASESIAKNVTVRFNNSYISNFYYNEETKKYTRGSKGSVMQDYFSKAEANFTNVFVLYASVSPYPDNIHTQVKLNGGNGYYITQGGYEQITWSKSGTSKPISFKDSAGNTLSVTPGNSYVCIVDKNFTNSFTAE